MVRLGLNAFILVARECKSDFLIIENNKPNFDDKFAKVFRALRLVGMSISDKLLRKWFEHVFYSLDCLKRDRRNFEQMKDEFDKMKDRDDLEKVKKNQNEKSNSEYSEKNLFLLPHEFLFLLCNTQNRLEIINEVHKRDMESKKGNIYQWELAAGKSLK